MTRCPVCNSQYWQDDPEGSGVFCESCGYMPSKENDMKKLHDLSKQVSDTCIVWERRQRGETYRLTGAMVAGLLEHLWGCDEISATGLEMEVDDGELLIHLTTEYES